MSRTKLRSVACLLLAATAASAAPARGEEKGVGRRSASDFHQRAPVEGDPVPGDAYAIPLSIEAVSARRDGGETRLFDADGREIPSLIETARERRVVVERPATIFNRAWTETGTLTVSVELTDRPAQPVNEFVVDIDADDYHLIARVEGGDDGVVWQIVGDGLHLIRHTLESERIEYTHDVLRIPEARYRYYRFTLTPHRELRSAGGGRPLELSSISVRRSVPRGASLSVPVEIERFDDPLDDDPRHHYWRLELPQADLGVDRIRLEIAADDYARSASVWEWSEERGRRTRRLAHAVVFQYGEEARTVLGGFQTDATSLVLMLDQGDDSPVTVEDVQASRPLQHLKFVAPATLRPPLAMYFHPDEAQRPRYDLARRLREREITSFRELAHAALQDNPGYEEPPEPRSEQVPYLLYLLVVPFVAGVGWYVARTIRKGLPDDAA